MISEPTSFEAHEQDSHAPFVRARDDLDFLIYAYFKILDFFLKLDRNSIFFVEDLHVFFCDEKEGRRIYEAPYIVYACTHTHTHRDKK